MVCLFPEGAISHSGQLGEFKRGYERTVEDVEGVILPFYLRGLWGSRFSRSSERMREIRSHGGRRDIIVAFGKPLPIGTRTDELKRAVFDLSIDTWGRHTDSSIHFLWRGFAASGDRAAAIAWPTPRGERHFPGARHSPLPSRYPA